MGESLAAYTAIGLADFACVPVAGAAGAGIAVGEFFSGPWTWTRFRHALLYDGWWDYTPPGTTEPDGDRAAQVVPGDSGSLGAGHYVFEAHPDGARRRRLAGRPEAIPGSLWSTGAFRLTPAQRGAIAGQVAELAGCGYSPADYFALSAHRLHIPAPGLRAFIAHSGHMICSQLVDYMHARAAPPSRLFADGRWPGFVTPYDLSVAISSRHRQVLSGLGPLP